jgi:hypothetical protein
MLKVQVRLDTVVAIPDAETVVRRVTRAIDIDLALQKLAMQRFDGICEAVELRDLLERRIRREVNDVEQCHHPVLG